MTIRHILVLSVCDERMVVMKQQAELISQSLSYHNVLLLIGLPGPGGQYADRYAVFTRNSHNPVDGISLYPLLPC